VGHGVGGTVAQETRVGGQVSARAAAEQAIERNAGRLARDVPERDVDPRERVHRGAVPAHAVQHALDLIVGREDLARVAADEHRTDERVDGRPGRVEDAVAEGFAPSREAGVGLDADQQHVDAGAGPATEHRRRSLDLHRQVEHDRLDASDLHGWRMILRDAS